MEPKLILILRRDPTDIDPGQMAQLRACFRPGQEFRFQRIDPVDFKEHAKICAELKPAAVILPLERPIPSLAMEQGIAHIAFLPDGTVGKLKPLTPEFELFWA